MAISIKDYICAGKATFTIVDDKMHIRCTYQVIPNKHKKNEYLVGTLCGPDNTRDYRFLGTFDKDKLELDSKEYACALDPKFQLLMTFLLFVKKGEIPDTMHLYKSNRCARCGRLLTTPESIENGIGPGCRRL